MSVLDNTVSWAPGPPCGKRVLSTAGKLLGFCEFQANHPGSCSHLMSSYRVWWDGTNRLRLP